MAFLPVDAAAAPFPRRRLVVVNESGSDQNFGLLAEPGSLEIAPNIGSQHLLAWRTIFVPGQSEGVTSRGQIDWMERCAFMLGRFGPRRTSFQAESIIPVPADGGRTFSVGFVGTAANGAAKLLRSEAGSNALVVRTDASFPIAEDRKGSTRHLALAATIDFDEDADAAAVAVAFAPNMVATLSFAPHYRIIPLMSGAEAGDIVPASETGTAHVLDFGDSRSISLIYTEKNAFEVVPASEAP